MKLNTLLAITSMAAMALAVSCQNRDLLTSDGGDNPEVTQITKLNNVDAQKAFAKLLSKAVSNSEDVRAFLKKEALAQFDNDYDVFYPFVKNKVVSDGKTFRDILMSYCDNEDELVQIEESSLLLNILVPDLTIVGSFCAETWDSTNSDVAIISKDDTNNILYSNGYEIGSLMQEQIPGFPCLVVKNNERMIVKNGATRSTQAKYDFACDAFNPSKTRRPYTRRPKEEEWPVPLEEAAGKPYAKYSELDPEVIKGWQEFGTDYKKAQRDYVYYGMTQNIPKGNIRGNYAEEVLMFRIVGTKFPLIADDKSGDLEESQKDPYWNKLDNDKHDRWKDKYDGSVSSGLGYGERDTEWILNNLWKGGNFEINIKTYLAPAGATLGSPTAEMQFSVPARTAFSIDKAQMHHWHGTWFTRQYHVYTISVDDVKGKWVRPSELPDLIDRHVFSKAWNLSNTSMDVHLFVSEWDQSATKEETYSVSNTYSTSVSGEIGGEIKDVNFKVGYGSSSSITTQSQVKIIRAQESDNLGMLTFSYLSPIIKNYDSNNGYEIHTEGNGFIEVALAPSKRF